MRSRLFVLAALASVAAFSAACGGNPTGPSPSEGVVLDGTLLGGTAALALHASAGSTAGADEITVTCRGNPAITTIVGTDGRFTLRGLPAGGFTLDFKQGSTPLGSLSFTEVKPNQEITITVALSGSSVALVEQKRNGIGHGDLEIEGLVQQVLLLDLAGDSRFLIDGHTVVARPGQTAIREGNTARTVSDVAVGRRVHVKGTWLPAEGGTQPVLASEIKLQDGDGAFACVAGAKAEVEGKITAKGAASITVLQQGKGIFECQVSPGTPIRKGNTSYKFEQLGTGWQVHVKGTAQGLVAGACTVVASEVKVQQD
jgi:hypothetical protein